MDVICGLSQDVLDTMREEFQTRSRGDDGLTATDFINVVDNYREHFEEPLKSLPEAERIGRLTALFRTIDYNGDQRVSWEEFTGFAIDAHMRKTQLLPHQNIPPYGYSSRREFDDTVLKTHYLRHWEPEGRIVVTTKASPFRALDPRTLAVAATLPQSVVGEGVPTACEYIPGSKLLVLAGSDARLRFFDRDLTLTRSGPLSCDTTQLCLHWHPESSILFSGGKCGSLSAYEVGKDDVVDDFHSTAADKRNIVARRVGGWAIHERNELMDFLFLPHYAQRVVTCSLDGCIYALDLEKGDAPHRAVSARSRPTPWKRLIGRMENGVLGVSYSDYCQVLCSVGYELTASIWLPNAPGHRTELVDHSNPHKESLTGIHAIPETPQVMTADVTGTVKVWDLRSMRCVQTFPVGWGPEESIALPVHTRLSSICYADSTGGLVTAAWRQIVVHRQHGEGVPAPLRACPAEEAPVSLITFNPTQRSFLTACGRDVRVWDMDQGCMSAVFAGIVTSDITALCLDEYGRRFYLGTQEGKIGCRVYQTGAEIFDVPSQNEHRSEVTMADYWHQKRVLITASLDGRVHIISDRDRGRTCIKIDAHRGAEVLSLSHSANLGLFASADSRFIATIDIQDPTKVVHTIDASPDGDCEVVAVRFLTGLAALVVSLSSGYIRLYSTRPLQRVLDGGRVDYSPCCLGQWPNSALHSAQRWGLRRALLARVVKRQRRTRTSSVVMQMSPIPATSPMSAASPIASPVPAVSPMSAAPSLCASPARAAARAPSIFASSPAQAGARAPSIFASSPAQAGARAPSIFASSPAQ
eukprot:Hpha_TRINITY_DN10671_c0_g1::TRINITY_DN10671_c0_g1_i3::g.156704::m.156704